MQATVSTQPSAPHVAVVARRKNVVRDVVDMKSSFYTILKEPIPTKNCFDVAMTTYTTPSVEYVMTVRVPQRFPFEPPTVELTKPKNHNANFRFLRKDWWKPTMTLRTMLIEVNHSLTQKHASPQNRNRGDQSPASRTPSSRGHRQ
ncbi:unnamed protein product [Caenorhabditis auriculariae]|uniref:Uncharacterized protein n=1 Tax=Caenorhabditis auriculariae TaxID=2777116 RepID=A0A8S1H4K1_9PELO|nr:unnamed protein product [Caenorhabditis auriculariae]